MLGAATGFSVISLTDYKHLIERPTGWQKMMMLNLWRMPAEQAARLVRFVEVPHDPDTWPVTAAASNEREVWDNILTVLVRHLSMLSDRDLDRSFLALAADNYHFSQSPVNLIGHPWTASIEEKQKACDVLPKTQDPEFWRRAFLVLYDAYQNLRSSTMTQQENISRMLGTVADPDTGQVPGRRTDVVKQAARKSVEAVKTQKEVEGVEKLLQEENIDLKHQLARVTEQMNALKLQQQAQLEEMMNIQEDQKKALEESRQQVFGLMEEQSELEKAMAICAVCLGRPQNSYRLKCGHIFCLECINQLVRYSSGSSGEEAHSKSPEGVLKRQCPTCREVFKENEKEPVFLQ